MTRSLTRRQALMPRRRILLVVPAAVAAAAALAACGSSGTSASGTSSSSSAAPAPSASASAAAAAVGLKTAKVGGVTVLASARGLTLYSFAPDTSARSACNGACATSWPPARPATTAAVKSPFATIKRSDGATQLTFRGHPLYTFVGDKAPGQASGNGVNAFGGLWHEAPASGGTAPAGTTSSNSGGYQY